MTKKAHPAHVELARRAISAHAATRDMPPGEATERACGALFDVLETAMGPDGLHALLARALRISVSDHPWLGNVRIEAGGDCTLSGLTDAASAMQRDEALNGCAALLSSVLWLLTSFIGEELTMRFVQRAWPTVSTRKLEGLST